MLEVSRQLKLTSFGATNWLCGLSLLRVSVPWRTRGGGAVIVGFGFSSAFWKHIFTKQLMLNYNVL